MATRRRFLKGSAAAISALALKGCAPVEQTAEKRGALPSDVLEAVALVALPVTALGEDGVKRVVAEFTRWLGELEPVAELDLPYLSTDEIQYGPPDPAPLWSSQLQALDIEAQKRHATPYVDLPRDRQEWILRGQLPEPASPGFPPAARAPHVVIGVLAFFYASSEANDLAYRAAIEKWTCRGLDTAPDRPTGKEA